MVNRKVVITGIGIVSAIGIGKEKFCNSLTNGISGIRPIALFKPFDRYHNFAYEIVGLDFARYLGSKGLRYLDRSTRFLLIAAKLALKDSRVEIAINKSDMGVVIGTDWGNLESNFYFHNLVLTKGPKEVNPMDFPPTITNYPASQLSIRYDLRGLNTTISRGFTSSIDAIGYATNMIKNHQIKMILAGGVENLSIELYTLFYKKRWLARVIKDMKTSCKPFDKTRNGLVLGEGACVLILEDMESVYKRNGNILAEVIGYGFYFGDDKEAIKKSIYLALQDAKLGPADIDYICANANGSIKKDKEELKAIIEIFGNFDRPIINSIKSMVGECFGATGAMQVSSTCLSLSKGIIPPTLNFQKYDDKLRKINIYTTKVKRKIDIAMVNSFGLDGNNACLILKKIS